MHAVLKLLRYLIGEVQATPTSNTLLARLNDIDTILTTGVNAWLIGLYGLTNTINQNQSLTAIRLNDIKALIGEVQADPSQYTVLKRLSNINSGVSDLKALIGEVQASPTENTVLERLKVIETELVAIKGYVDGIEGFVDGIEGLLGGGLPSALVSDTVKVQIFGSENVAVPQNATSKYLMVDDPTTQAKLEDAMQKATSPSFDQDTDSLEAIREAIDALNGGVTFTDYHYYADLASGANYVPPVKTSGHYNAEDMAIADVCYDFYDGSGWVQNDQDVGRYGYFAQDDAQSMRIINNDGVNAKKISLTGKTWGGTGYADYHYYADIAGGATYTPTAQSFGLFLGEDIDGTEIHPEFYDGSGWVSDGSSDEHGWSYFEQDTDQNIRFINSAVGAFKISLTGATWS